MRLKYKKYKRTLAEGLKSLGGLDLSPQQIALLPELKKHVKDVVGIAIAGPRLRLGVFSGARRFIERTIRDFDRPFTYYAIQERLVKECVGDDRSLMTDPKDRLHTDWDFGERWGFSEMFYETLPDKEKIVLEAVKKKNEVKFTRKYLVSRKGRKGFLVLFDARRMVESLKKQNDELLYDYDNKSTFFREDRLYCSREVEFRVVEITCEPLPLDNHRVL